VWTGNRSRSCLSRASASAFSDAAGVGAGPAGAGACRSSSFCWIIFSPSSTSMTVQIDAIDLSVFLLVCSRKILVDSPCWAATQATGSQCGGGWLWCMGNGAGGGAERLRTLGCLVAAALAQEQRVVVRRFVPLPLICAQRAGAGRPAPGGARGPGGQSRDPTQVCRVEVRHGRGGADDPARSRLRLVYLGRCRVGRKRRRPGDN